MYPDLLNTLKIELLGRWKAITSDQGGWPQFLDGSAGSVVSVNSTACAVLTLGSIDQHCLTDIKLSKACRYIVNSALQDGGWCARQQELRKGTPSTLTTSLAVMALSCFDLPDAQTSRCLSKAIDRLALEQHDNSAWGVFLDGKQDSSSPLATAYVVKALVAAGAKVPIPTPQLDKAAQWLGGFLNNECNGPALDGQRLAICSLCFEALTTVNSNSPILTKVRAKIIHDISTLDSNALLDKIDRFENKLDVIDWTHLVTARLCIFAAVVGKMILAHTLHSALRIRMDRGAWVTTLSGQLSRPVWAAFEIVNAEVAYRKCLKQNPWYMPLSRVWETCRREIGKGMTNTFWRVTTYAILIVAVLIGAYITGTDDYVISWIKRRFTPN
jgi:hypothetical protein